MISRVPVVRGRKPLMPMKLTKAYRFVLARKAKWKWNDKLKIRYLQLLFEPSGYDTQPIHLGIDHGSVFDGFSVSSDRCCHENIELIHNKTIKERLVKRSGYRRTRRCRLRHRKIRFDSRTADKTAPTIRAMLWYRKWLTSALVKLYPISKVVFEQVKYKGPRQKSYAHVHQGQNALIDYLTKELGNVEIIDSDSTEGFRRKVFSKFGFDPKVKEITKKGGRSFYTHCIDSFTISRMGLKIISIFNILNNKVVFVTKNNFIRRELYRTKSNFGDRKRYFRYGKENVKRYFTKSSKLSKVRVKINEDHSNHPKRWNYQYLTQVECLKSFRSRYGGTVVIGASNHHNYRGASKYEEFRNKKLVGFTRRHIEIVIGF